MQAFLERRDRRWRAWFADAVARLAPDPADRPLAVFDALGEWFASDDFRGCAFLNAAAEITDPDHPARDGGAPARGAPAAPSIPALCARGRPSTIRRPPPPRSSCSWRAPSSAPSSRAARPRPPAPAPPPSGCCPRPAPSSRGGTHESPAPPDSASASTSSRTPRSSTSPRPTACSRSRAASIPSSTPSSSPIPRARCRPRPASPCCPTTASATSRRWTRSSSPGGFGTRQEMHNRRLHDFIASQPPDHAPHQRLHRLLDLRRDGAARRRDGDQPQGARPRRGRARPARCRSIVSPRSRPACTISRARVVDAGRIVTAGRHRLGHGDGLPPAAPRRLRRGPHRRRSRG